MRGPPVVLTDTLGRPVTNVISERGAVPMTVVNTLGEPVTLVNSGGEPVTLFNENGTLWDYPFSLFSNNEQGAWYDPSDFSTLFQNAAGTTPVTAVEQPVRLMLDRSKGLVLGGELVTNGGFDSATGWTLGAGWSISGGQLLYPTGAGVTDATQNIITANRLYVMEIDVASLSGSTLIVFVGSSTFVTITTIGVHRFQLFTTGDNRLIIRPNATSTNVAINSISVRELPGNHALAPNDASRPVLRARYNLLTYTEQFDNAGWTKGGATVSANSTVAPDGTTTADTLTEDTSTGDHRTFQLVSLAATAYTFNVYLKPNGRSLVTLTLAAIGDATFDISAGTVTSTVLGIASITAAANGWYRCALQFTGTATSYNAQIRLVSTGTTTSYTGNGTSGVFLWGAQLLTSADQTATGGAYQRIAAATDYDTSNPVWRPYLAFDGSDDSFSTSAIDFSGTDEMTVFAGVTKLSDAATGRVIELSANPTTTIGAFNVSAPSGVAANYGVDLTGDNAGAAQSIDVRVSSYAAPITNVVTVALDIGQSTAATELVPRVNGATPGTIDRFGAASAGTGNFGNYPLFIGRRNNTSNPFNGRLYGLTVLGRTATAAELSAMEAWVAGKTGVTL